MLDLELIGPCSVFGVDVNLDDTVATIDKMNRVRFHRVTGVEKESRGVFTVVVRGGAKYLSSECWLIYAKKQPKTTKLPPEK